MNEHPETTETIDADTDAAIDAALEQVRVAARAALELACKRWPVLAQAPNITINLTIGADSHWCYTCTSDGKRTLCGYGNNNVGFRGGLAAAFNGLAAQVTEARHE